MDAVGGGRGEGGGATENEAGGLEKKTSRKRRDVAPSGARAQKLELRVK